MIKQIIQIEKDHNNYYPDEKGGIELNISEITIDK